MTLRVRTRQTDSWRVRIGKVTSTVEVDIPLFVSDLVVVSSYAGSNIRAAGASREGKPEVLHGDIIGSLQRDLQHPWVPVQTRIAARGLLDGIEERIKVITDSEEGGKRTDSLVSLKSFYCEKMH